MQGRKTSALSLALVALLLPFAGCDGTPPPPPAEDATPANIGSRFDPMTAGTIRGRVTWEGDVPAVAPFRARINWLTGPPPEQRLVRANPNAPHIDADSRGVRDAVVYLEGVDPAKSKPWDHPAVRVEQCGRRLHVRQGTADSPVGFVRRGEGVKMVSKDSLLHSLHADGAAFFTLTFPDPGRPRSRRLGDKGLVELSSAAGYYWMRAYLFVDDLPYYARTDARGRFTLQRVPPGRYRLVAWLPNWNKDRHERDPETGTIIRWFFAAPVRHPRPVAVVTGRTVEVDFRFGAKDFCPHP
jgi:hypothetical protein